MQTAQTIKRECLLQDQFQAPVRAEEWRGRRGKLVDTAQAPNLVSRVLCQGFESNTAHSHLISTPTNADT